MKDHSQSLGTPGTLVRTGRLIAFLDVSIGQPFWAHAKVWTRITYDAAAEMHSTNVRCGSVCNFIIDEIDRYVEELEYRS